MLRNERKDYENYVGLVLTTMPESMSAINEIETFLIAECFGNKEKQFTVVYGKLSNNVFYYKKNVDDNLYKFCDCEDLIKLIKMGKVYINQDFVHRKFIDMRIPKNDIKKILGRISFLHTVG